MTEHPGQEYLDQLEPREAERKQAEREREARLIAEAQARREAARQQEGTP